MIRVSSLDGELARFSLVRHEARLDECPMCILLGTPHQNSWSNISPSKSSDLDSVGPGVDMFGVLLLGDRWKE